MNVGLIFTNTSYHAMMTLIESDFIEMEAKAGLVAPCDVSLPVGLTDIDAGDGMKIFHKMNIPITLVRSMISIDFGIVIVRKNEIVSEDVEFLCKMLNMTPLKYSLEFKYVMLEDGEIIGDEIVRMDSSCVLNLLKNGLKALTAISLCAG